MIISVVFVDNYETNDSLFLSNNTKNFLTLFLLQTDMLKYNDEDKKVTNVDHRLLFSNNFGLRSLRLNVGSVYIRFK